MPEYICRANGVISSTSAPAIGSRGQGVQHLHMGVAATQQHEPLAHRDIVVIQGSSRRSATKATERPPVLSASPETMTAVSGGNCGASSPKASWKVGGHVAALVHPGRRHRRQNAARCSARGACRRCPARCRAGHARPTPSTGWRRAVASPDAGARQAQGLALPEGHLRQRQVKAHADLEGGVVAGLAAQVAGRGGCLHAPRPGQRGRHGRLAKPCTRLP
jgi:hypothetical protein